MQLPSSNKINAIYTAMQKELAGVYSREEIRSMWFLLLEAYLGWPVIEVLQKEDASITESEMLKLHFAIKELKAQKPLQYIIGYTWFYDLKISVNPAVLIPRPETEELVAWVIHDYKTASDPQKLSILDIGTGSGCIALALASALGSEAVTAMDISQEAMVVAGENARTLGLKLSFIKGDILDDSFCTKDKFDVIVSNPPYVRLSEKKQMQLNVLKHEPEGALFVSDDDPLIYYKHILKFAQTALKAGGSLYFEINEALGQDMLELVNSYAFADAELRSDINGRPRMLKAIHNLS